MIAAVINGWGVRLEEHGNRAAARFAYRCASWLAPGWSPPWFNLGLIAKRERRWPEARRLNRRAADLDPNDPPTWWNLGIAATALGDWATAREAWSRYGIHVPDGAGPIDMDLGPVPVRIAPDEAPEVVWCTRLDPARALIRSIPTPASGRACGDVILNDGEPKGSRQLGDRELAVFDELQLLTPGALSTFEVSIVAPAQADVDALAEVADAAGLMAEDWDSIRWLCRQCSEGTPHEDHAPPERVWAIARVVAVAAPSTEAAAAALESWRERGPGRAFDRIECVLERPSPTPLAAPRP